jgi:hypothetical protein
MKSSLYLWNPLAGLSGLTRPERRPGTRERASKTFTKKAGAAPIEAHLKPVSTAHPPHEILDPNRRRN